MSRQRYVAPGLCMYRTDCQQLLSTCLGWGRKQLVTVFEACRRLCCGVVVLDAFACAACIPEYRHCPRLPPTMASWIVTHTLCQTRRLHQVSKALQAVNAVRGFDWPAALIPSGGKAPGADLEPALGLLNAQTVAALQSSWQEAKRKAPAHRHLQHAFAFQVWLCGRRIFMNIRAAGSSANVSDRSGICRSDARWTPWAVC